MGALGFRLPISEASVWKYEGVGECRCKDIRAMSDTQASPSGGGGIAPRIPPGRVSEMGPSGIAVRKGPVVPAGTAA